MGRVKEIFIELQNQYGQNLEDAPEGFSMEDYLKRKADEMEYMSVCCGANLNKMVTPNGPDYKDIGICPDCGDNV